MTNKISNVDPLTGCEQDQVPSIGLPEVLPTKRTRKRKVPCETIPTSDLVNALADTKELFEQTPNVITEIFPEVFGTPEEVKPNGKIVVSRLSLIKMIERSTGFIEASSKTYDSKQILLDDVVMIFHPWELEIQYASEGINVRDVMPILENSFSKTTRTIILPVSVVKKIKLMKGNIISFVFSLKSLDSWLVDPITKRGETIWKDYVDVAVEDYEFTRKSYLQQKELPLLFVPKVIDDNYVSALLTLKNFVEDINAVAYCISDDATKPHLNFAQVFCGDKNVVVATDGYRLAYRNLYFPSGGQIFERFTSFMVSPKLLKLLKNLQKEKDYNFGAISINVFNMTYKASVIMTVGSMTIEYRTDHKFPPWEAILPHAEDLRNIYVDPIKLMEKLEVFKGLTEAKADDAFAFRKTLGNDYFEILEPGHGQIGGNNTVSCRVYTSDPVGCVSEYYNHYNIKYMIEILKQISNYDGGHIKVNENAKSVTQITNGVDTVIIMPVRKD